ncbi:DeoR family transcriptional regulator [Candidatus Kaiserbacteria bacterium]|nr:DeoR family transcriptional regulator [Candidatus Kaiserbacteria bacterium]
MSDNIKDENKLDQDKLDSNVSVFDNIANVFSNSYHTFLVRKSERLASALYVITGFMPQEEPVRGRLRVCALELITRSTAPSEMADTGTEKFESRCAEIGTILQTAHYAGLVSEMNAKLIGEEYAALASFVRLNSGKISERGHELQKSSVSEPRGVSSPIRHTSKSLLKEFSKSKKTQYNNNSGSLNDRKTIILNIFNTKPKVSIKDAVSLIPTVSAKTIQRDLLSLVEQGILIKEGARRWTTYSKAS